MIPKAFATLFWGEILRVDLSASGPNLAREEERAEIALLAEIVDRHR
jgi:hypothetical protein